MHVFKFIRYDHYLLEILIRLQMNSGVHLIFYPSLILLEAKNTETCFRQVCLTSDKSATIKYVSKSSENFRKRRWFFLDVR